ncbi:hypothetical protein [Vibrio cholerae]|uniref:hypothetical protein n=1 Tax=Vibrio cholerae TaxID=666 RepID=UPI0029351CAF|nr:hypothetical protein [Vibrio cholerae]MDV2298807.1 hypothetical protein [Vibrio cholerae]
MNNKKTLLAVSLAESDKDYVLIARAVAGQTFDTDKGGTITASFELSAPAGAMILNPYTTLAFIEDKTIDEVASDLNINGYLRNGSPFVSSFRQHLRLTHSQRHH